MTKNRFADQLEKLDKDWFNAPLGDAGRAQKAMANFVSENLKEICAELRKANV